VTPFQTLEDRMDAAWVKMAEKYGEWTAEEMRERWWDWVERVPYYALAALTRW